MEDKSKVLESDPVEIKQGSGSILAAARKQQDKTIEDIAAELNLSVTQIKTIELDQTEGLPEPTYVRGYIRGYAKLLGLDASEVLQSYLNPNWERSTNLNDIPGGISSAETSAKGFWSTSKVIVVLMLGALLIFAWYAGFINSWLGESGQNSRAFSSVSSTTTPEIVSSNEQAQLEQSGVEIIGASSLPDGGDSTTTEINTDSNNGESGLGGTSESEGSGDSSVNTLKMSFSATSWVDVRDEDNNRLAFQNYKKGEQLDLSSEQKLRVFIGNAEAVTVEFNGASFDIDQDQESLYASFVLGN